MPQPAPVADLSEQLRALYTQVQARLEAEQQALAADPRQWRRQARLRELLGTVDRLTGEADAQARAWVSGDFTRAYSLGASTSAAVMGDTFTWTTPHLDAVTVLANDLFSDLLAATDGVRASAKQLVRRLAKEQTAQALVGGETASGAGGVLADLLEGRGIWAVRYADGSLHGVSDYADMAIRTKSAYAFNAGTLAGAADVDWFEIFDGNDCGWTSHEDPDRANGSIRSRDEALATPLSHPRCRRGIGARPDITSKRQAADATPSTTDAQREDQSAFEQARADQLAARRKRLQGQSALERRQELLAKRAAKVAG